MSNQMRQCELLKKTYSYQNMYFILFLDFIYVNICALFAQLHRLPESGSQLLGDGGLSDPVRGTL